MRQELLPDRPWKPNLFVIGAAKCGTTSLCHYLGQHPEIFISKQKEPLFFCSDQVHREPWREPDPERYLAMFEPGADRRWRGEGSVWYLNSRIAPLRIRAYSPEARILILLRNPVDMVASLHAQFLFSGNETIRDLAEAYAAQQDRAEGRRVPWRAHMPDGLQYRELARYAGQVERILETFPRQQVKVLIFEEFFADVAAGYREVLDFLDVDTGFAPDFAVRNERHQLRSVTLQRLLMKLPELWRPAGQDAGPLQRRLEQLRARLLLFNTSGAGRRSGVTPALRRRLHEDDFAQDIARLERLLDKDLSIWRAKNLGTPSARSQPRTGPLSAQTA